MRTSVRRRAGAAAVAVTLLLGAVACSTDTDPSSDVSKGADPSQAPSDSPSADESPGGDETTDDGTAVPIYFVTDSPAGPRLVREFHRVSGDPLTEAARLVAGAGQPVDPDYRSLWPEVEIVEVTATDGVLLVEITGDAFTSRPDGMSKAEARLAVQQLVYTLQGVQQERVPVMVQRDSDPQMLFDLPTSQPFKQASALKTLNLVNITTPAEGQTASGTLEVSGVANSFEANVICELVASDEVVTTVPFTAEGWMEDKLFPFAGEIPLADAGTGDVLLRCSTDDPSGGGEGPGAFTDTRLIQVK